jgi:SAM-dependent methyltransferase
MEFDQILKRTASYYSDKIKSHGATARGVDWNSAESQILRFAQLLKLCDSNASFSINDYGCGYGALATYLSSLGYDFQYSGFDISAEMLVSARKLHLGQSRITFVGDHTLLPTADYTVASGIFNVKQDASNDDWHSYVLHTLHKLAEQSTRGFAFNLLTRYSDADRMRPDLYYGDPLELFDYCKQHFSRSVALLHDYPLYEFTIIVRQ